MSLIDELRGKQPYYKKKLKKDKRTSSKTPIGYFPTFLHVVNRKGFYAMSKTSFNEHTSECIRETGTLLGLWLISKGYDYRIKPGNIYKIFKIKVT